MSVMMRGSLGASLLLLLLLLLMGDTALCFSASSAQRSSLRMDTEGVENSIYVQNILHKNKQVLTIPPPPVCPIRQAEAALGMPWRTSIDPSHDTEKGLLYMPFWEWQLNFMKRHLHNLTLVPATNLNGTMDFALHENYSDKARISNLCFASDEYRKIRMTYYDAGPKTQVFNSLWYPRANLPVLGIDLLCFHEKKHLAVVDFQPLHQSEEEHDLPYSHLMQPIQAQYPSLQGKMSKRFYDETKFFSPHMLFSRFENQRVVHEELQPAFRQYVSTHVKLAKSASSSSTKTPWSRHAAYDAYSAQRDPATTMFENMFGKEWSESFVHEFLFSMSRGLHKDEEADEQ